MHTFLKKKKRRKNKHRNIEMHTQTQKILKKKTLIIIVKGNPKMNQTKKQKHMNFII